MTTQVQYLHALAEFATAGNQTFTLASLDPIFNRYAICKFIKRKAIFCIQAILHLASQLVASTLVE